jgi:hypothetical protein
MTAGSKFKTGLRNSTPQTLLNRVDEILGKVKASGQLTPELTAEVPTLQKLADDEKEAMRQLGLAEDALKAARAKLKASTQKLHQEASRYCQMAALAAGSDVQAGIGYGLIEVVVTAPKQVLLEPPAGLHIVSFGGGKIVVECDAVKGAKRYLLERSFDPPSDTSWSSVAGGTSRRRTVKGLPPGQRMWFRMAAVTSNGQSPWSAPQLIVIA